MRVKSCVALRHHHLSLIRGAQEHSADQLSLAGNSGLSRQHFAQYTLQSHDMHAFSVLGEKIAVAAPFAFIEAEHMIVILPPEKCGKGENGHTFRFFCITPGFFDLADVTGAHLFPTSKVYYRLFKKSIRIRLELVN